MNENQRFPDHLWLFLGSRRFGARKSADRRRMILSVPARLVLPHCTLDNYRALRCLSERQEIPWIAFAVPPGLDSMVLATRIRPGGPRGRSHTTIIRTRTRTSCTSGSRLQIYDLLISTTAVRLWSHMWTDPSRMETLPVFCSTAGGLYACLDQCDTRARLLAFPKAPCLRSVWQDDQRPLRGQRACQITTGQIILQARQSRSSRTSEPG